MWIDAEFGYPPSPEKTKDKRYFRLLRPVVYHEPDPDLIIGQKVVGGKIGR